MSGLAAASDSSSSAWRDRGVHHLNTLYAHYLAIHAAELKENLEPDRPDKTDDHRKATQSALVYSCAVLKELLEDPFVKSLGVSVSLDPNATREIALLWMKNHLEEFLEQERKILKAAKLDPDMLDDILSTENLHTLFSYEDPFGLVDLASRLYKLKDYICNEADRFNKKNDYGFFVMRVIKLVFGTIVIYVNVDPSLGSMLSEPQRALSVAFGGGFIGNGLGPRS